jgi:DNA topoisomerase I
MSRLRRSDPAEPGIRRIRRGRGFSYVTADGSPTTEIERARIAALAIPPAWTDVWICAQPNGHIQATGRDQAGRLQYRYHNEWQAKRDGLKHERVRALAQRLPAARERASRDMRRRGLVRERVLAAAFRMLDLGSFRIGSECYEESNGTFGLATLKRDHVTVEGHRITFCYEAKGGQEVTISLTDRSLASVVRDLRERDDDHPDLLGYQDGSRWIDVRSSDINDYIREISGMKVSAKDLRTWNATVRMAVALAECGDPPAAERDRRRVVAECMTEVSTHLGNTPAVARRSYVDSRVIDLWLGGVALERVASSSPDLADKRLAALLSDA